MGDIRQIPPLEAFFGNGGVAVVLRATSIVQREGEGGADALSLEQHKMRARIRLAASHEVPDLVLAAPNKAACGTVQQRGWPMAVFVQELDLPPLTTEDGWIIREAYETNGNVPLRAYRVSSPRVRDALTRWASAASAAIERALRVRVVHRGRVIICGGGPFVGLIASHLIPKHVRHEGAGWMQPLLNERISERAGFTVNRAGEFRGIYEVKPLYVGPPPVPPQARIISKLPLPGSGK